MNYVDYVKPAVGTLLQKLKLDKKYVSAKDGNLYYINEQGKTVEVRDFIGGYGSLVLGHNCKPLVDYARQLLEDNIPVHDQLSIKKYTGLLAKAISDEIGLHTGKEYISTFTNSGAETVEVAIKHAPFKKIERAERHSGPGTQKPERHQQFDGEREYTGINVQWQVLCKF